MTLQPNSPEARDVAYLLHPYTNFRQHEEQGPMIIERGDGVHVWDNNGKKYIEGMAGLWSTSLGFHHKRLVAAATKQMETLPYYHQFAQKSHLPGIDLAEKLMGLAPTSVSKVFFNNSGSEANDTAIKIIWYYNNARGRHQKKKIIGRVNGYHGITLAAASLTGRSMNHAGFDAPLDRFIHTENPHYYRFGEDGESEEDFATRMADSLDKLIQDEGPDTVAAFFAEPVMGAGGVITPPKTYFQKIQAVLRKHDVLFVADEVICGFCRTGNFWASQTYGIEPDLLVCAKALSSSYLPISATMVSDDVYQAIADASARLGVFGHGYTYSGHPVAAAVALETLKIYEEEEILDHVRSIVPRFQERLTGFADHPLVGEVRGVGLVGANELVKDKGTKEAFETSDGVGGMISNYCLEHGLITRPVGDSMCFCPPLVITEGEIDELFDRYTKALNQGLDQLTRQGKAVA
ncbi:MAG: aspartate aminotransferase family protein [Rhodospirillaceae bacterium]|nr:aspartate aminotransferase family protein [Rhodospirillaceae bacterium]